MTTSPPHTARPWRRRALSALLLTATLLSSSAAVAQQETEWKDRKTTIFGQEQTNGVWSYAALFGMLTTTSFVFTEIWLEGMTTYSTTDPPDDVTTARLLNDYVKTHRDHVLDAAALGGGRAVRDLAMILRVPEASLARGGAGIRHHRQALHAALNMRYGQARGQALHEVLNQAFGITPAAARQGGAR